MKGGENVPAFIIIFLAAIGIFACLKWVKWKITALTVTAFVADQFREPTESERKKYVEFAVRHLLHL